MVVYIIFFYNFFKPILNPVGWVFKIKYIRDVFKHHKPLETVRAGQPGTSSLIQLALCEVKLCVCRSLSLYQSLRSPRPP